MTQISTKTTWCDECKLKVFECDHLRHRDAEDVEVARSVPHDMPRDPDRNGLVFLAFNSVIPALTTCNLHAAPQVVVKPRRLVVDPKIADACLLLDIKIGMNSQFAAWGGGVSCAIFPPTPPKYQPIANLSGLPVINIGQNLILTILNRDTTAQDFNALVWCDYKLD